ncbi:DUF6520 family protein [Epilithonimonas sp.]|uniref:DUF6520 family protein n=1 Tax=Epilithonimonas sp. TaxID=2894511 RepID=UPI0028994852|nr:DUF6520 family protein [Epilithonimonas sp.]
MKKFILPVCVGLLATGAALTTQSFKAHNSAIVDGHMLDVSDPANPKCENTFIACSTIPSAFACQDGNGNVLRELQGTSCPESLYRP